MTTRIAAMMAALMVTGCVTAGDEWPEMQPIRPAQSIIPFDSAQVGAYMVQSRIGHSGAVQEQWTWETGGLLARKAGYAEYYRADFDEDDFIEMAMAWNYLSGIDLKIDPASIRTAKNEMGSFLYAVSDANNAGETCVVYVQPLPLRPLANYRDPRGERSGGFVTGFDCRALDATNGEDTFVKDALTFLGA